MTYQTKAVPVEAWQWNGEERVKWPAWVKAWRGGDGEAITLSKAVATPNARNVHALRIPATWTTKYAEVRQWLVRSSIGARDIEVHSDEAFWDKFQRVTEVRLRGTK
jgi:hypothetical protein